MDGSAGAYIFTGPELFLRHERLAELTSNALKGEPADMAVVRFDGDDTPLATVLDELRTLPFLASRRIVVIDDAESFISQHNEKLTAYLAAPCSTGVLILLAESGNVKRFNFFKAVSQVGGWIDCQSPAAAELPAWVRDRARAAYRKKIDMPTAGLLADLVGEDLGRLDSELAKLATFLGEGRETISAEDVDDLVANHRLHDAFELTGAIGAKDAAAALARWTDMVAKEPDAPYRAVGLVGWQLRQFLRARLQRNKGTSADEILRGLRMPYSARNQFAQNIRKFSVARLRGLIRELVEVDVAAKTGGAPPERGVEQFIIKACH
ncbi:MAG: putative protein YqeN [Phycisphaerae bacterium]|nr:putative protein YqeN [Phycisphaerae bacterium]